MLRIGYIVFCATSILFVLISLFNAYSYMRIPLINMSKRTTRLEDSQHVENNRVLFLKSESFSACKTGSNLNYNTKMLNDNDNDNEFKIKKILEHSGCKNFIRDESEIDGDKNNDQGKNCSNFKKVYLICLSTLEKNI
ncbi:hypothetical protein EDEG_03106 [Edhazardia aedis USNM 41457]|uniref:Uncharacterized protein n=1 Tax=Edhazardia aedis (strain USNM 41457) TaxID=1003232 RepID=J9D3T8_EDHAE|nr:hypothetical protein EDEG_03106 [Edhazardia aedis USNM 41457]|eukprot:EJW02486.1 hypothetical protein EDEG_03106 [Edhazardia aedis USNM 41457]